MKAERRARLCTWAGLILTLSLVALVRWRLAGMPLERDEGEYAYSGQLLLDGVPPYRAAYNMKFPGVYAAYAVILKTFGETLTGIHLGILVVNAISIILLFVLMRRIWSQWAALAAALIFALMTMDMHSLGMAGHATHFVVLFELTGLVVLTGARPRSDKWRLLVAGILLGLCIVMKQPGAAFVFFAFIWMIIQRRRFLLRRCLALGVGALLPIVVMCFWLWHDGVFGRFWFWTIDYARFYASQNSAGRAPEIFFREFIFLTHDSFGLWALAVLGLLLGWTVKERRSAMVFVFSLCACSVLAASAGFYYRPHYFILIMPAAAMLAAATLSAVATRLNRLHPSLGGPVAATLCGLACATLLVRQRQFFFEMSPEVACRQVYTSDSFAESPAVAAYLAEQTSPQDRIAVFGSEPQIYFYAHRRSATGYIYTYSLMEIQPHALQMQREMAREISAAHPSYIVVVSDYGSWAVSDRSEGWIFDWFNEYKKGYELVKTFDVWADRQLYYDRGEITRMPTTKSSLQILRRIDR
jgi:hypothetical protein